MIISLSSVSSQTNCKLNSEQCILVDDEVWGKAEHVAVALLVRSPAQTKGHEEKPGALQQGHLVIEVQVPET